MVDSHTIARVKKEKKFRSRCARCTFLRHLGLERAHCGTFHNSLIADYGAYERMEEIYNLYGAKDVVDLAFNLANKNSTL